MQLRLVGLYVRSAYLNIMVLKANINADDMGGGNNPISRD